MQSAILKAINNLPHNRFYNREEILDKIHTNVCSRLWTLGEKPWRTHVLKKKKSRTLSRVKPFIIDTEDLLMSVTTKTVNQQ